MKLNKSLAYFFLVAILTLTLQTTQTVKAVSLSPLTFELAANPGETVSNVIKVTNTDPQPVNVVMEVQDFAAIGEEGQVTLQPDESDYTYSLAKWVTITPEVLSLKPNGAGTVQFTINVPPDAEPGGHYGSVLASISAVTSSTGGPTIAQKVGSLVLMNIAGDVREQLHIKEFSAEPFSEYGPVVLVSRFENNGTIHLKARGFILIKNIFGKEIEQLDLPQKNVLPRSIRRIEVPWGDKFMFGRYEATLTAIYGSTNQPVSAVTSFWVIPWKVAGAVLIGLIIILAFFIRGRKRIRLALSILFRGVQKESDPNFHA